MSGISLQTTGGVSSRFVSETDLDKAKATKDQEWKAAYERLGQAPPPREEEEVYDPRSLFEKLQQKKDIKREEMDEKMKMSNQHRGLNEEELGFLTDHKNKSDRDARQRRLEEEAVLDQFRSAQRRSPTPPGAHYPIASTSTSAPIAPSASLPPPKPKTKSKKGIPGVVVKKKAKAAAPAATASVPAPIVVGDGKKREHEDVKEAEGDVGEEEEEEEAGSKKAKLS